MGILGLLAIINTILYGVLTWGDSGAGNPYIRVNVMFVASLLLVWGLDGIIGSHLVGLLGVGVGGYGVYFMWCKCYAHG